MKLKNQTNTYGWVSILLHWSLSLAILGLFAVGVWMVELDYYSSWYHDAPFIHKSVGVFVVMLMLMRLGWNLINVSPRLLAKPLLNMVARSVHQLLYLLVFLLGVSGYLIATAEMQPISVFGWFEIPAMIDAFAGQADLAGEIHAWLAYGLIALVFAHAGASLLHHFVFKDDTLRRMLKPLNHKSTHD